MEREDGKPLRRVQISRIALVIVYNFCTPMAARPLLAPNTIVSDAHGRGAVSEAAVQARTLLHQKPMVLFLTPGTRPKGW